MRRPSLARPPKYPEEACKAGLQPLTGEKFRDVSAFGFLDIEADICNPLGLVKGEHLFGRVQTPFREHGDDMERHSLLPQQPNPGERLVKGAPAGTRDSMCVVELPRAVDAHTDTDPPGLEELAPLSGYQHAVGLHRMADAHRFGAQCIDRPERALVECARHHERLTGVPNHRKVIASPA